MERLQKYLARCGIASRRAAENLILNGKVKVNGKIIKILGTKINPQEDLIEVMNKKIIPEQLRYYLLNKPKGYVTAAKDKRDKIVIELLPKKPRVFPVGRLDKDTTGLLILTNDGDFAYQLTHPKFEKEKEYFVVARATTKSKNKNLNIKNIESLRDYILINFKRGIRLEEGVAKADKLYILAQKGDAIEFNITIHRGWNRQIRRMCEAIGLKVVALKRIRVGNLKLGNLAVGKWRRLNKEEISNI